MNHHRLPWNEILQIDWRPRPYELVLIAFAVITITLLYTFSPLPLSVSFAKAFVLSTVELALITYGLAVFVIGFRIVANIKRSGASSALTKTALYPTLLPYFSLNFLMLTLRRIISILGIIYFFLHLKHIILLINPSNHDLFFWNLDRFLHFGYQPNIVLLEKFGQNHDLALLIDWLYIKYFDYKVIVSVFFLLELKGRRLSESYFLAYSLLWAFGGLSYLVLPTDGPCFAVLTGYSVDPDQLMHAFPFPIVSEIPAQYVDTYVQAKIWFAKQFQETLWDARFTFLMGRAYPSMFYGIAAMPSLHVAAVTMLAYYLIRTNIILGVLGVLYLLLIFFGSIFLQWHYACDGYIGVLLALFVCWASNKIVARYWEIRSV